MDKNEFLIELSETDRTQVGKVEFADQPEDQKVFTAIWELESNVNNGGFDSFIRHVDGASIRYAGEALRRIGAQRCAEIVERALRMVSLEPLPDEQDARETLLESAGDGALADADQEFFAYPDDLTELLFEFVRARPAVFGPVP